MKPGDLQVLKAALKLLEQYEVQIEGEWGAGRSLKQLEALGYLPPEILDLRALIARMEAT